MSELSPKRKDYLKRLIAGVRRQVDKDPTTIEVRAEYGDECTPARWIDAELLCSVIESDILGIKSEEEDKHD